MGHSRSARVRHARRTAGNDPASEAALIAADAAPRLPPSSARSKSAMRIVAEAAARAAVSRAVDRRRAR